MTSIDVTIENLDQTITDNEIVFLDFWASWCGPCQQFAPIYEAAAEANPDLTFGSINTEEQQQLSAGFEVRSIPTLMAFRDQIMVFNQPGALNQQQLDQVIAGVKGLDMDQVRAEVAKQQAGTQGP